MLEGVAVILTDELDWMKAKFVPTFDVDLPYNSLADKGCDFGEDAAVIAKEISS